MLGLVLMAGFLLSLSGCVVETLDCSDERCEVWICGSARPACPCSDLCERPACSDLPVFARDPASGACVPLESPCMVPEGWEYFTDEASCAGGRLMCRSDADCAGDQVCDIRSCVSDDVGTCVPRPERCPEGGTPVWGCDGRQYTNDCERLLAGASLGPQDAVSGCVDDMPLWARDPATGTCSYYADSCHVPQGWATFFSRAECEARGCSEGSVWVFDEDEGRCVEIATDCDVPPGDEFFASVDACEGAVRRCTSDAECSEGSVCEPMSCGSEAGQCVPWPGECLELTSESALGEVCGCDGTTYLNDCERLRAGAGLAHRGPCAESGPAPGS